MYWVSCMYVHVQGSFGKPDNRECTVAEFSDNHDEASRQNEMNWMQYAGTISL